MDDWQLRPSTRQKRVRKIMTVLKKNHPANDEDGLLELRKIAQRLEEKAYSTATSRSGYLRIINSKLKSMEATRVDWQEEVYQKQEPLPPPHMHTAQQPQSQVTQLPTQNNVPIFISIPSNAASDSSKPLVPVNWRPNQGAEPAIHVSVWRAELPPESRQRAVSRILDTFQRHLPISGEEGLRERQKIVQRFEEKIYTTATSKSDYLRKISLKLRKISLKLLTMDSKSADPTPSDRASNSSKPPVLGVGMQFQNDDLTNGRRASASKRKR